MKNVFRRRPSASMVVALSALFVATSGTAVAATGVLNGSRIKKHSIPGNRLENHAITAKQIDKSKLGIVPSATDADYATTAGSATDATNATTASAAPISKVTYVTNTAPLSPGFFTLVTATCPAGTTVIGGGGEVSNEAPAYVNDTYPDGKTGWSVDFFDKLTALGITGTTTAICAPTAATAP